MTLQSLTLIPSAYAQETAAPAAATATGAEGSPFAGLFPLILIFGIFYFFLIRPQQKKMKQHAQMTESLRRGDKVVTGGGIIGTITKVEGNEAHVEISPSVRIRVMKSTITEVLTRTGPADAEEKKED